MLRLTALTTLVALTTALPQAMMTTAMMPMPDQGAPDMGPMPTAPCCVGRRWQGTMIDLKATDGYKYLINFAEDSVLMRDGSRVIDRMTGQVVEEVYNDYKANMTYTVDYNGKCVKSMPGHAFFGSCDHPSYMAAQYVGNGTMGGVDPHTKGIFYDAWSMQFPNDINVTISLSRGYCVPLLEQYSQRLPKLDVLMLLSDVTTTMVEDALLNMPKACVDAVVG